MSKTALLCGILAIGGAVMAGMSLSGNTSDSPGGKPGPRASTESKTETKSGPEIGPTGKTLETATFGSGCFWCTEAVFQQLKGVESVVSGYTGGHVDNPTYEQICTGTTGHAEVIQLRFDPAMISYDELLDAFWHSHDPTTLNRQGNDRGPQYRSAIFYHDERQKAAAEAMRRKLDGENAFGAPIVTEITPISRFYPAEKYHQNYFNDNPQNPYCSFLIAPKLEKFKKKYADKIKPESK